MFAHGKPRKRTGQCEKFLPGGGGNEIVALRSRTTRAMPGPVALACAWDSARAVAAAAVFAAARSPLGVCWAQGMSSSKIALRNAGVNLSACC